MIPKIIHYCWFGGNKKPAIVENCIESWKKYCPDYEIKEWNDNNYDFTKNKYITEAYRAKKWAFVSDYARLDILVNIGGIYLDTDVEIVKNLDCFLNQDAFVSFQSKDEIQTGVMATIKGHSMFVEFLNHYNNIDFLNTDGSYNLSPNVVFITKIFLNYNLKLNNEFQIINNCAVYPWEYFCPIQLQPKYGYYPTKNTATIHHFTGSWLSAKQKRKMKILNFLGPNLTNILVKIKKTLRIR